VQRWADRFAAALTPVVAVVAVAALVWWTRAASLGQGVLVSLAVVLAACPCSYAIASPLVQWLAMRRAFARGVLLRSPEALEALAQVRAVAFDKTGTLTRDELRVVDERVAPGVDRAEALALVAALEEGLAHPVARALYAHARAFRVGSLRARNVPGRGVEAMDRHSRRIVLGAGPDGSIALLREGRELLRFTLEEALRPEAGEAIATLHRDRVRALVLSGDDASRVARVAQALDLEAHAGLSPEDKLAHLAALEHAALVGDGVNDAPALAGRLASFTFGGAAQLAKGVAQVTLLEPDLRLVPWTLTLARRAIRSIKWLLGASTAYNLIFVALAAGGTLRPVWAGLSMLTSSLIALSFAASNGGARDAAEPPPVAAEAAA
jgi:Cu2+-exporting ATPase